MKKLNLGNARQTSSLSELLRSADVVSLHVPANATTRKLMDASALDLLKGSAVLINASRGDVVDLAALACAHWADIENHFIAAHIRDGTDYA